MCVPILLNLLIVINCKGSGYSILAMESGTSHTQEYTQLERVSIASGYI
jgi:hypothetical protein